MIEVGEPIPDAQLQTLVNGRIATFSIREKLKDKKVVIFAVPGAFTPGCTRVHLPGYVKHAPESKAKGFDGIYCLSVNDAYVMNAWGLSANALDEVEMLADGSAQFVTKLGLAVDLSNYGMGTRSQRFSMTLEDCVVTSLQIDAHTIQKTGAIFTCIGARVGLIAPKGRYSNANPKRSKMH